MKRTSAALTLMASVGVGLLGWAPADGASPALVITTVQDAVHPPHTPPTGTFTAIGVPGCPAGTYADSLVYFTPNGTRVVVDETYTCVGGATFTARMALHIAPTAPDQTQAADGTWRIVASDSGVAGSGQLTGLGTGCSPVGAVFAECTGATGLIVGKAK